MFTALHPARFSIALAHVGRLLGSDAWWPVCTARGAARPASDSAQGGCRQRPAPRVFALAPAPFRYKGSPPPAPLQHAPSTSSLSFAQPSPDPSLRFSSPWIPTAPAPQVRTSGLGLGVHRRARGESLDPYHSLSGHCLPLSKGFPCTLFSEFS